MNPMTGCMGGGIRASANLIKSHTNSTTKKDLLSACYFCPATSEPLLNTSEPRKNIQTQRDDSDSALSDDEDKTKHFDD